MSSDDRRRRILLVVRWPVGGIRTFLRYVYRGFDPQEWRITLVAPRTEELDVLLAEDLRFLDIEFVSLGDDPGAAAFTAGVARLLAGRRFDLVHSHGFTAGVCTALPAALRRTPHLMTAHETINEGQFAGRAGTAKKAFVGSCLQRIGGIQSVSHDAERNLLEFFPELPRERCRVVPSGIEVERFRIGERRDLRAELELEPDRFLVGFLGRFMSPKGFRYLVDAVEILAGREDLPRRALVVAFGWGGFIREEQRDIVRRGLEDSFRFLPFAANAAESIRGLDVVAMPSLWEACGLLAMEVLVAGTPLIASDCIGLREVVAGTPATVVPPADGPALAEAIALHMSRDLAPRFRDFVPDAARRYDARTQIEGILELYRELARPRV